VLAFFRTSFSFLQPKTRGCRGGYVNMLDAWDMVITDYEEAAFFPDLSQVSGHVRIPYRMFLGIRGDTILPLFFRRPSFYFPIPPIIIDPSIPLSAGRFLAVTMVY
jgi:hypothetical protein